VLSDHEKEDFQEIGEDMEEKSGREETVQPPEPKSYFDEHKEDVLVQLSL
jgi:hypothetical protein